MSGYIMCLEKAGAKIIDQKEIGSYQGTWGAIADYNGMRCLITGYYGSCSGCDSFYGEFDFVNEPTFKDGKYWRSEYTYDPDDEITKEQYDEAVVALDKRYSDFAQSYLTTPMYKVDVEKKLESFKTDDYFDSEEKELYQWALKFFE